MENKINRLISFAKGKKNFGLDNNYVLEFFKDNYFKDLFKKDFKFIIKNKKFRDKVKEVRRELYKTYGVFQVKKQWKKKELLKELCNAKTSKDFKIISEKILKLHSSSRERFKDYKKIYKKIFGLTGKPRSILDIGCGLNPCYFILSGFKGKCYCYDISKDDVDFLNNYFKFTKDYGIKGKAFLRDIRKDFNYPKTDACFLFKILDLLEKERKYFFNELITRLKCKYLIVSFSKKTISLKNMGKIERKWFKKVLEKSGLKYKILDFESEYFYVIKLI